MKRIRVIPVLLLKNEGLYKTLKFKDPKYIGDPINVVKILNEKEADELVLLDISATAEGKGPNYEKIAEIASEAFVPLGYGGGIRTIEDIKRIFHCGVEKVVINTAAVENPQLISEAASLFGNQSIVVSVDVTKNIFGSYKVFSHCGRKKTSLNLVEWVHRIEELGAGEILINSIDRDGTFGGYDMKLISLAGSATTLPVVACGGAASIEDFAQAVQSGASAVAAGSMFIFQKSRSGILVSFPSERELIDKFYCHIQD